MIYIAIIIFLDIQYYYELRTTLLNTIFTVTIIYTNIASIMSKEEEYGEYGDKTNSQPEEDIEIKEEKEVEEIEISDRAENKIAYINTNTQSQFP